uniref:Uncharacterized protein n=1 Tax=Lepeophtheirus salmonis TaxID=72036 RepID=A0A0K2UF51_LEPSM
MIPICQPQFRFSSIIIYGVICVLGRWPGMETHNNGREAFIFGGHLKDFVYFLIKFCQLNLIKPLF